MGKSLKIKSLNAQNLFCHSSLNLSSKSNATLQCSNTSK